MAGHVRVRRPCGGPARPGGGGNQTGAAIRGQLAQAITNGKECGETPVDTDTDATSAAAGLLALVREVLVPRREVFILSIDIPVAQARKALAESGYSRAPVARGGHLDDVVGRGHLARPARRRPLPGGGGAPGRGVAGNGAGDDAMRRFKDEREQFALVANEHGAIDGIITLEDLLEEIVGEIYDETDRDLQEVHTEPDGSMNMPGTFPIHDLPDLGVEITDAPDGDYATVAGLVLAVLGRIAEPGDRVEFTDWAIEVTGTDRNAITAIRLQPRVTTSAPG